MQRPVVIALVLAAIIAAGVLVYLQFLRESPEPPATTSPPLEVPPSEPATPEPFSPALELPLLNASDDLVRALANGLSSHPQLAATLATDDLIRKFVATVDNIANGESPRSHLSFLEFDEPFRVVEHEGRTVVDPGSYRRYDWIADAFTSLDAEGSVELYEQLKPLLDEAYRELGYPSGDFGEAFSAALDRLVSTPIPEGDVEVQLHVLQYEFKDEALETLSAAEKHLLRMGPANAGKVQSKLRELRTLLRQPPRP